MFYTIDLNSANQRSQALQLVQLLRGYDQQRDLIDKISRSMVRDDIIQLLEMNPFVTANLDRLLVADSHAIAVTESQVIIAYNDNRIIKPILILFNTHIS